MRLKFYLGFTSFQYLNPRPWFLFLCEIWVFYIQSGKPLPGTKAFSQMEFTDRDPMAAPLELVSGTAGIDNGFSKPHVGSGLSKPQMGNGFRAIKMDSGFSKPQNGQCFSNPKMGSGFSKPQNEQCFSNPKGTVGSGNPKPPNPQNGQWVQ